MVEIVYGSYMEAGEIRPDKFVMKRYEDLGKDWEAYIQPEEKVVSDGVLANWKW